MSDVGNYACVRNGKVEMLVRWDGVAVWPPAADYLMVDLVNDSGVGVGWDYVDGQFVDNRPPVDQDE